MGQFVSQACPQSARRQQVSTELRSHLLMASLSHLSCCSILLTSRALNTQSAVSTKHSALLLLTPSHTPNLHLGSILFSGSEDIGLASTFCPNGTNSCAGFLPCNHAILRVAFDRLDPSGTWTRCSPHVPPTTARLGKSSRSSSCVQPSTWQVMVLRTPRNNITAFSTNPFESFVSLDRVLQRDLCFAILSHAISERDYCRLCVAFQRDLFVPQRVDESCHALACPRVSRFPSSELRCS